MPQTMTPPGYLPPLANVIDLLVDAVCVVNDQHEFVYVSASSEQIFGYRPEEMIGRPMTDFMHPDDCARTFAQVTSIVDGTASPHFENRYVRKDGSVVDVMWTARHSPEDGVRVAVARDVTGRKRSELLQSALYAISEAAHAAADLSELFGRVHEIIGGLLPARNCFVALYEELEGTISFPYFVDEFDAPPEPRRLDSGTLSGEVIRNGKPLLFRSDDAEHPYECVRAVIAGRPPGHAPLAWLGVPLIAPRGVIGALVVQSYSGEVTYGENDLQLLQFVSTQVAAAIERKQIQAQLNHLALYDHLTDLPNRTLLRDRLANALSLARREVGRVAMLFLDLDRFKDINDQQGHGAGDQLLQEVARRLTGCVRESDTVARLSGDEFAVLLPRIERHEDALRVAEKLRRAMHLPFAMKGGSVRVSASIGIALYPDHGESEDALLRLADDAMYAAKRRGGNRLLMSMVPPAVDD
ncbi:sensor domain-containing protein [Dyella lutea]|uniref:Diguanylate cyclase n=1 Tax=Dyella lutea TaxID=2950441 RepID=A0ABT1FCD2_9GAMM|nr:diguanylate cyclase [Dyella lutea]MCP1374795.1 diguanylate cyclase [Dyella lutea]